MILILKCPDLSRKIATIVYPCSHCVHLDSMSYCWMKKVYWKDMFGKSCDEMEYEDWVQELIIKVLEAKK